MSLNRVSNNNAGGARSQFGINANNLALENTEELRRRLGNSNIAKNARNLRSSMNLQDYDESARSFQQQSFSQQNALGIFPGFEAPRGTTLSDFKTIKNDAAGFRPNDFYRRYTMGSINATLSDFQRTQGEFWQKQDEFVGINTDVLLTRELEAHYKTLISMEDEYKSLVESGRQIDSFKVKGDINRFKTRIDALKSQMVKDLT
jgi:hypothetical protein